MSIILWSKNIFSYLYMTVLLPQNFTWTGDVDLEIFKKLNFWALKYPKAVWVTKEELNYEIWIIMMLMDIVMNEFIINLPYFAISRVISNYAISIFGSHLILHSKTWHFQQHKLTPNTNMYKRVYIANDAYKSRYFVRSVEVADFLFSKMSTVIFTLLGCFKDIYFALTIL